LADRAGAEPRSGRPGRGADVVVRSAAPGDAEALLTIYRPFVVETAISFEVEPPTVAEFRERIERTLKGWAWLVAEREGRILGYAYATAHRPRGAYHWSVEPSVYLAPAAQRQGIGTKLYAALLPQLADKGYCNAYAGITLPNDGSVALHERMGFQLVGVFRSVGWKFGAWHDVSWWHLRLRPSPPTDAGPPAV
jgi:phosphinothricin acetyltransferase